MRKHGIAIFVVMIFASIWMLNSYTKSHTQNEVFNYLVKFKDTNHLKFIQLKLK